MSSTHHHSAWLQTFSLHQDQRATLICFPYAGGSASIFRAWKPFLPDWLGFLAVQPPGRESRFNEPLISNIESYAEQACSEIKKLGSQKKLVLFGHSLGAIAAFETALKLESAGVSPALVIVSGRQYPGGASIRSASAHLPDDLFIASIARLNATAGNILENKDLLELLLPMLRADFTLSEQYQYDGMTRLNCPVLALGSNEDEWINRESIEGWRAMTLSQFEIHWFEGDHFYLNHHTQLLVDYLVKKIQLIKNIG